MIAGPQVQICDECVDICLTIIAERRTDEHPGSVEERHSPVLLCGVCRMVTPLDHSLAIRDRGIVCAGCLAEIQAALAEQEPPA